MKVHLLAAVLLAGCYEAKPQLPKGYLGSPVRSGWPPAAAYAPDNFHPANRLFQRLYVLRAEGPVAGSVSPSQTDVPFSPRETLGAVDRAEIRALLSALSRGEDGFGSIPSPAARWVLASDLTAFLARFASRDRSDPEFLEELASAALAARGSAAPEPAPLPPPLRAGDWSEEAVPPVPAFRPSAADLRWTRIFRREGESVLLRLRISAGPAGEPILLPIGSEAWHLSAGKGSAAPAARLYHLKREKLARGADPWEEVPPGSVAAIRDPLDPSRPPPSGRLPELCTRCHPGPGLEARGPSARAPSTKARDAAPPVAAPAPAPPGAALAAEAPAGSAQREDARRALEALVWPR